MKLKDAIDRAALFKTLEDLIAINSVNPAFGGPGEGAVSAYVASFFQAAGIPTKTEVLEEHRSNVIGCLEGATPDRLIIFDAHGDTASASGMSIEPFQPLSRAGRMYGRGACDTKAGLAAMLHAARLVKQLGQQPRVSVWVVATVDEEYSLKGIRALVKKVKAVAAVVSEPTGLSPIIASKGCLRWRINVQGKAAHSSKPHLGENAIYRMCRLVRQIETQMPGLLDQVSHPLLGSPTVNVGLIQGGTQVNFVPETCSICVDRRTIPGESRATVYAQFQHLIDQLHVQVPGFRASMEEPMLEMVPLATSEDSPIAQISAKITGQVAGAGQCLGVPFGSNASELGASGIPAVVLGPGSIDQAHAAVEFVELEQVLLATEIYARIMLEF